MASVAALYSLLQCSIVITKILCVIIKNCVVSINPRKTEKRDVHETCFQSQL